MGNNLIIECKFNMGLESVNYATVWRMLSGPTTSPLPPYSSFQHMAVNRWITWSQFTSCLKSVNELMTQVPQNINGWITWSQVTAHLTSNLTLIFLIDSPHIILINLKSMKLFSNNMPSIHKIFEYGNIAIEELFDNDISEKGHNTEQMINEKLSITLSFCYKTQWK